MRTDVTRTDLRRTIADLRALCRASDYAADTVRHIGMRVTGLAAAAAVLIVWRVTGHSMAGADIPTMLFGLLGFAGTASWAYALPAFVQELRALLHGQVCLDCGSSLDDQHDEHEEVTA